MMKLYLSSLKTKFCFLIAFVLVDSSLSLNAGEKIAFLVAVEPWPDKEKTEKGAGWKDLQAVTSLLKHKWGFEDKRIHTIYNSSATTESIIKQFRKYVATVAKPGDVVFIYWSSHGTQVADLNSDEPDGLDEAYVTFNHDWSDPKTWFTDDLFAQLLGEIKTSNILVVTDTCHSGGSIRGDGGNEVLAKSISSGFTPTKKQLTKLIPLKKPSHIIHLAACKANELSYGSVGVGSYFTTELVKSLKAMSDNSSFHDAFKKLKPQIQKIYKTIKVDKGNPKTWSPEYTGPITKKISDYLKPNPQKITSNINENPFPDQRIYFSGEIQVQLKTNKQSYKIGEQMQIQLSVDTDCYIRLYYMSAERKLYNIFPNKFQKSNFIKKDSPLFFPAKNGTFGFEVSHPTGNEILMAVASSIPFTEEKEQELEDQLFLEYKNKNLAELATRGIKVTGEKPKTGRAIQIYKVTK